jgi:hypothetical protein
MTLFYGYLIDGQLLCSAWLRCGTYCLFRIGLSVGYPIIGLGLSAFNYRIIHIRQISLTPYPNPHPHTIGFGLSTSACISKTILHIHIIQIRIGSYAESIHTTFITNHYRAFVLCSFKFYSSSLNVISVFFQVWLHIWSSFLMRGFQFFST